MSKFSDNLLFVKKLFFGTVFILYAVQCEAWSGKIIDKKTKEPIGNAVIVRSLDRKYANPAGQISSHVALTETVSDANGDFSISNWKGLARISIPLFAPVVENRYVIYKPGYKVLTGSEKVKSVELEELPNNYYLRKEQLDIAKSGNYSFRLEETKIYKSLTDQDDIDIKFLNRNVDGVIVKGLFGEEINLVNPTDIGIDSQGKILIIDTNFKIEKARKHWNAVRVFDAFGNFIENIEIDTKGSRLGQIYIDENDDIYISSNNFLDLFYKNSNYKKLKRLGGQNVWPIMAFETVDGDNFLIRHYDNIHGTNNDDFTLIYLSSTSRCESSLLKDAHTYKNILIDVSSNGGEYFILSRNLKEMVRPAVHDYIEVFDKECKSILRTPIKTERQPTCLLVGANEIIVSDGSNLYFYDRSYNLIHTEKFKSQFSRLEEGLKNSYLGAMHISRMKADKNWKYLYLIDSVYDRILKYDLTKREWPMVRSGD